MSQNQDKVKVLSKAQSDTAANLYRKLNEFYDKYKPYDDLVGKQQKAMRLLDPENNMKPVDTDKRTIGDLIHGFSPHVFNVKPGIGLQAFEQAFRDGLGRWDRRKNNVQAALKEQLKSEDVKPAVLEEVSNDWKNLLYAVGQMETALWVMEADFKAPNEVVSWPV